MNRYFIHNQEYENALGKVNNKMKISFIGALKILEQSGYGLGGKDLSLRVNIRLIFFHRSK